MSAPTLYLRRVEQEDTHTLGELRLPSGKTLYILENPWLDNAIGKSCLPPGRYPVRMEHSPKFGSRYHIEDDSIAPRNHVLFHGGNFVRHTRGCPLPGLRAGTDPEEGRAVWDSEEALRLLEEEMGGQPFVLSIQDASEEDVK